MRNPERNYYFSHRIYCNVSYKELINLVSGFLYSHKYRTDEESSGKNRGYFQYSDFTEADDGEKAYVVAATSRTEMREWSGYIFRIINLRRKVTQGLFKYEDLPISVKQRFALCPNYIEISSNQHAYKGQLFNGERLANWLKERGRQAYIRSFGGELTDIIETSSKTPDNAKEEIYGLAQSFLEKNHLPDFSKNLSPFSLFYLIPHLSPDAISVLKTAEILNDQNFDLPDYSPLILQYCKIIEIEIEGKILYPLKSYFQQQPGAITVNNRIGRLNNYLLKDKKSLELGTFASTIQQALQISHDSVAKQFLEEINRLPFPNSRAKDLVSNIFTLTRKFRNPAAHKSIMSHTSLSECRELILGTDNKTGLLFKLVYIS